MSEDMKNKFIELLGYCFQMNSHSDNVAYWLGFNQLVEAEEIFHEKYAHEFPQLADEISNFMIKMGKRPVRPALTSDEEDYPNLIIVFSDVKQMLDKFRAKIQECLDIAEINNETECKVFLENFLFNLVKYVNQVRIWAKKAEQIGDNPVKFDKYFDDFTVI